MTLKNVTFAQNTPVRQASVRGPGGVPAPPHTQPQAPRVLARALCMLPL